jgi:predicted secreted protein
MIVSGGITRLYRPELPATMGVSLAIVIEVPPSDRLVPHELAIEILDPRSRPIAKIDGGMQVGTDAPLDPDETALVPVALDLRMVAVAEVGWHSINVSLDSAPAHSLRFKVVQAMPATSGRPPVPGGRPITH